MTLGKTRNNHQYSYEIGAVINYDMSALFIVQSVLCVNTYLTGWKLIAHLLCPEHDMIFVILNCSFIFTYLILKSHQMKKFNITSNSLATIALTCVVWICVLISAAFALQGTHMYIDSIAAISWLIIAGFFEWMKHKITHQD